MIANRISQFWRLCGHRSFLHTGSPMGYQVLSGMSKALILKQEIKYTLFGLCFYSYLSIYFTIEAQLKMTKSTSSLSHKGRFLSLGINILKNVPMERYQPGDTLLWLKLAWQKVLQQSHMPWGLLYRSVSISCSGAHSHTPHVFDLPLPWSFVSQAIIRNSSRSRCKGSIRCNGCLSQQYLRWNRNLSLQLKMALQGGQAVISSEGPKIVIHILSMQSQFQN